MKYLDIVVRQIKQEYIDSQDQYQIISIPYSPKNSTMLYALQHNNYIVNEKGQMLDQIIQKQESFEYLVNQIKIKGKVNKNCIIVLFFVCSCYVALEINENIFNDENRSHFKYLLSLFEILRQYICKIYLYGQENEFIQRIEKWVQIIKNGFDAIVESQLQKQLERKRKNDKDQFLYKINQNGFVPQFLFTNETKPLSYINCIPDPRVPQKIVQLVPNRKRSIFDGYNEDKIRPYFYKFKSPQKFFVNYILQIMPTPKVNYESYNKRLKEFEAKKSISNPPEQKKKQLKHKNQQYFIEQEPKPVAFEKTMKTEIKSIVLKNNLPKIVFTYSNQ